MNKSTISYAILYKNELDKLQSLLTFLYTSIDRTDEIIILYDSKHITDESVEFLNTFKKQCKEVNLNFKYEFRELNNDFAGQKNYLTSLCNNDYVFNIDTDESITVQFIHVIHKLLEENPNIDIFILPRINIVSNITKDDIKMWGWNINENGWINWPDYQMRIYKNKCGIEWKGKVHETLTNYKTFSHLPYNIETVNSPFYLIHKKSIEKQREQNKFYKTI